MANEGNFTLRIEVDAEQPKLELSDLKAQNDEVTRAAVKARREVERTVRAAGSMLRSLMSATRAYIQLFGFSVDAIGNALINVVDSIIAAAIAYAALQTAIALGTAGLVNAVALGAAIVSIEIATIQIIAVATGNERAKQQLDRLDAAVSATSGFVDSLGGMR